jgi:hypothetical protein
MDRSRRLDQVPARVSGRVPSGPDDTRLRDDWLGIPDGAQPCGTQRNRLHVRTRRARPSGPMIPKRQPEPGKRISCCAAANFWNWA